ncbi:MAG: excalibur calcium-binding domain-containing protein, partial [Pseudomonadota bacterium]
SDDAIRFDNLGDFAFACRQFAIFLGYSSTMADLDALRDAFRDDAPVDRKTARADKTRAQAFSPVRILVRLLMMPFVALGVGLSIYTYASPFDRTDTLRHLVAMAGCEAAERVGLRHMAEGSAGYHSRLDTDGNGIVCEDPARLQAEAQEATAPNTGAKFIRPE